MFANEFQNAPIKLVINGDTMKGFINRMWMLGRRFIHAAAAVDIVNEDEAAWFDKREAIRQVFPCALKSVIAVDEQDIDLSRQLISKLRQSLLGITAAKLKLLVW